LAHSCQSYPGTMVVNYKTQIECGYNSCVATYLLHPKNFYLFFFLSLNSFFFFFFLEPFWLTHLQLFCNIGHTPKIEAWRCFHPPTFATNLYLYVYIWKFNFGQSIWDKSVVLWEHLEKLFENLRNPLRTQWEPPKNNTSQWPYVLQAYEFPFVPHLETQCSQHFPSYLWCSYHSSGLGLYVNNIFPN